MLLFPQLSSVYGDLGASPVAAEGDLEEPEGQSRDVQTNQRCNRGAIAHPGITGVCMPCLRCHGGRGGGATGSRVPACTVKQWSELAMRTGLSTSVRLRYKFAKVQQKCAITQRVLLSMHSFDFQKGATNN